MKNKNQKLFIIVGVLMLLGSIYFIPTKKERIITTISIKDSTIKMEVIDNKKGISIIKVIAKGDNELITYNLVWKGLVSSKLDYKVYKTATKQNIDKLGNYISKGKITKDKEVLVNNEFITATNDGSVVYYYIVSDENINGKINVEESNAKPIIAAYIKQSDGSYIESDNIPQSGYILNTTKSICSNNVIPEWDTDTHTFSTSNLTKSGTSCYLYFDKQLTASETLIATGNLINENGYRYEGKDVNNYVTFNNELWRIIGVFDTTVVDETSGAQKQEQLIKIIRDEVIEGIAWDSNNVNDWTTASLKTLLNEGDYYNRSGDYSSNGLTDEAKKMIENVVWNLGGSDTPETTTDAFYSAERGSTGANGTTDTTKLKWTGKVGLMYPSDYGYASPASTCIRTTTLLDYDEGTTSGCSDNNWLYKSSYYQWMITPSSSLASRAFGVYINGYLTTTLASYGYGGSPSVYLKSSVKIVDGEGSESLPYVLSIS